MQIQKITNNDGVLAIMAIHLETDEAAFEGDGRYDELLKNACGMHSVLGLANEPGRSRIVIDQITVILESTPSGHIVAVATQTGHAIGKSIRRMVRQMFRAPTNQTPRKRGMIRNTKPRELVPPFEPKAALPSDEV